MFILVLVIYAVFQNGVAKKLKHGGMQLWQTRAPRSRHGQTFTNTAVGWMGKKIVGDLITNMVQFE